MKSLEAAIETNYNLIGKYCSNFYMEGKSIAC